MRLLRIISLALVGIFIMFFSNEKTEVKNNVVHVSNEQLDYNNEYVKFENVKEEVLDNNYNINLDSRVNINSLVSYDMVSLENFKDIIINYNANLNLDNGIIEIEISVIDEFGVKQTDNLKGFLQQDGSLMLVDQDGESIFITEDELFEQCGWFKNLINTVKNVVKTVASGVKAVVSETKVLCEALVKSVEQTLVAIGNRALTILFDTSSFITDLGYGNKSIVDEHYRHNSKLSIHDYAWYGIYLNDQSNLDNFLIGKKGDLNKNGCGIVAMYNVLAKKRIFNKENASSNLADLIRFEENYFGTAACGYAGITPGGITRGLIKYDIYATSFCDVNNFLKKLNKSSIGTSAILLCLNDYNDITEGMHYYMVEKVGNNEYCMYNNTNEYTSSPSTRVNVNQIIGSKEALMIGFVC